jgi:hypothetical protein
VAKETIAFIKENASTFSLHPSAAEIDLQVSTPKPAIHQIAIWQRITRVRTKCNQTNPDSLTVSPKSKSNRMAKTGFFIIRSNYTI